MTGVCVCVCVCTAVYVCVCLSDDLQSLEVGVTGVCVCVCVCTAVYVCLCLSVDDLQSLEVGVTGIALPVDVQLDIPSQHRESHDPNSVKFGECGVGSNTKVTLKMTNRSPELPATYQFRRIAHFACHPARGCLQPRQSADIVVTFAPRQIGLYSLSVVIVLRDRWVCTL